MFYHFLLTQFFNCAFGVLGTCLLPPISDDTSQLTYDLSTKDLLDLDCRSLDVARLPHVLLKHCTNTSQNIEMELNISYRLEDDSVISSSLRLALILAFVVGTAQLTTMKTKTVKKKVAVQPAGPVFHNGNVDTSCFNSPKMTLGNERLAWVEVLDMMNGRRSTSNPKVQIPFDSDVASGHYVLLHRPFAEGPQGDDPHVNYFKGKRRLWEARISCTFKTAVKMEDLRISTSPYERLPMTAAQATTQRLLVRCFGKSLNCYNSPGDDPSGITEGEVEKPLTSVPMTEVDQYIPSLAGEAQPDLLDASFPKLGRLKVNNPSAYRADLRKVSIQPGECHTFAFWGVSRMVDLIEWKLQTIPFVKNTSMDAINGAPPVVLTIYVLNPGGEGETRHLDSRMAVLWKTALWSTKYPPSPERLNALQAAITASGHDISRFDDDEHDNDEPPVHQRAPMSAKIKGLPHEGSICCLAGLRKLTGCSHAC